MIALTFSTMTVAQWAILIIITAVIIAIVVAVLKQLNIAIPAFIINILWILLAGIIGILAIKFLITMF